MCANDSFATRDCPLHSKFSSCRTCLHIFGCTDVFLVCLIVVSSLVDVSCSDCHTQQVDSEDIFLCWGNWRMTVQLLSLYQKKV